MLEHEMQPVETQFFYYLRDVVLLLGGERRLADLLLRRELITMDDVHEVRNLAATLVDATKERLNNLNRISVVTAGPDVDDVDDVDFDDDDDDDEDEWFYAPKNL